PASYYLLVTSWICSDRSCIKALLITYQCLVSGKIFPMRRKVLTTDSSPSSLLDNRRLAWALAGSAASLQATSSGITSRVSLAADNKSSVRLEFSPVENP